MSAILYGLKISFRRPVSWVGTLIGITLAVSLVYGSFISTDYVGYGTMYRALDDVLVDLRVDISGGDIAVLENYRSILERIDAIDGVNYSDMFGYIYASVVLAHEGINSSSISPEFESSVNIFFINPETDTRGLEIEGNVYGGMGLGSSIADYLGVTVGDEVALILSNGTNLTSMVSHVDRFGGRYIEVVKWLLMRSYEEETFLPGLVGGEGEEFPIFLNPNYAVVVSFENYSFINRIMGKYFYYNGNNTKFPYVPICVFIDKESVVDIWDLDGSIRRLERIENEVRRVLQDTGLMFSIENIILDRITTLRTLFSFVKFGFALQLLPIVILGFLLAMITNWIVVNKRRMEIGLMKVRGMTSRQIFICLLVEAVIIGCIGGSLGLTIAYFSSIYITGKYATQFVSIINPHSVITEIAPTYIKSALIFGSILAIVSVILPARRVSNLDVDVALADYVEEVEAEVRFSKKLLVLLILSSWGIIEIVFALPTLRFLSKTIAAAGPFTIIALIAFFAIYFFSVFIGPFIFPYAFTKLIASKAERLNKLLYFLSRPLSGELSKIAVENFIRRKTRVYKVIMLIALTLSFGVFFMINNATSTKRVKMDVEFYTGADIRVSLSVPVTYAGDLYRNISGIDGVKGLCLVAMVYSGEQGSYTEYKQLVLVNENYFDISFFRDEYLEYTSIDNAKKVLESKNRVLLSIYSKRQRDYKVGEEFMFSIGPKDREYVLDFSVAGFIKFAPGITGMLDPQQYVIGFVGFSVLDRLSETYRSWILITTVLIDAEGNSTDVALRVKENLEDLGIYSSIFVYDKAIRDIDNLWIFLYQRVFTTIMFYLSISMAIAGMALTMVSSIMERRREIALLRTRGASRRDIIGIIGGEALVITILGYLIGLFVSIAYSYGLLVSVFSLPYLLNGISIELPPGYAIVVPVELLIVLFLAFIIFIVSSIIPLYLLLRKELTEELRIRH